ncbi:MAG: asparagine synthase-related protein [Natronomonas sp.]
MDGAGPDSVRRAIESGDALPGGGGFAGSLDGVLLRDVLGRYPLFSDGDDPTTWSFDPTDLDDPKPVPAGSRRDETGDTKVWTLPNPDPYADHERAIEDLRDAIESARSSVDEGARPAVAFSGGIDSSLLAETGTPLYVGGFEGSHDVEAARDAATALDRSDDLRVVTFTHDDLRRAVRRVVSATGRRNPMDVGIASALFLVAEAAAADGVDRLVVGQGADELFGGYSKVARAPEDDRLEAETVRGATREVIETLPAQLERDVLTLRAAGVEPVAPMLRDEVIRVALRLPDELLVEDGETPTRKVALRRVATDLPDSIRTRDKKAVQYGSLLSRELDRLARQAGFKRRMDDHVGRYIESLVD